MTGSTVSPHLAGSALPSPFEAIAAAIPVLAIVGLAVFAPSVFTHPDAFFVYAFLQAAVFLLTIRFFDLYEREPLSVLALMAIWGATGAGFLALFGNQLVNRILAEDVELVFGAAISAPPVEELAKGIALIAAFQLSRWANRRFGFLEFEGVTDGIVYGAAVGLGFALAEDVFYFFKFADEGVAQGLEVFRKRVDFFGATMLGHALYTAAFGAGLGLATWSRSRRARYGWPLLGLAIAMLLHAIWNGFASLMLVSQHGWGTTVHVWGCATGSDAHCSQLPAGGVEEITTTLETAKTATEIMFYVALAGIALAMALWLRYQRRVIRYELAQEVGSGLVEAGEVELLTRYGRRSKLYWQLLRAGQVERWRATRRLHNELVDLAFLKWRLEHVGADTQELERRRRRIGMLRTHAATAV